MSRTPKSAAKKTARRPTVPKAAMAKKDHGQNNPAKNNPAKNNLDTNHHTQNDLWTLRLYIAGQTPKSLTAIANLKRICEKHLPELYHIEVVDLAANPQLAMTDQILAIPTLVRKLPEPVRKIIGDLSNLERVLISLEIHDRLGVAMSVPNAAKKGV